MRKFLLILALFILVPVAAFAEAFDVTVGGSTGVPANAFGPYTIVYNLDVAKHGGFDAADTLDIIKIPKGAVVYGVNYKVIQGDVLTTATVDVGDAANATGYLANQVSNSTATTDAFALAYDGTAGKSYADGGKIRLTFDHAVTTLKAKVSVIVMPFHN